MLLKWIRCTVNGRVEFDRRQRAWADLRGFAGFLGQRGGWDRANSSVAHVFGLWADRASYQAFMSGPHDLIASRQANTFTDVDVLLYETQQTIGHTPEEVNRQQMLRVARCKVHAGRVSHFTEVQASVWNPGMIRTPGFQGGVFAQRELNEFLVVTQWENSDAHDEYLRERFPGLREHATPDLDVQSIIGHQIVLQATWYVPGTPS
ncbi:DUF4937 domain-containing protein [Kribbella sp. VKM Ac-2566]|uniref:DUF4937 domain-containing protein n=1 Tax=Kribbella sp. VKM Ac-2566 TaxID=2512218 RepID=UPI0010625907|nr:DUF4937 domain-containing protein [Kribbella sp. VKM Ac-2566]TDX08332.1 antibiotic biosynthesis monooxygenase [Kribbella sp. VKM Ac-2566]